LFVPVLAGGTVRSSVLLARRNGVWKPVAFGSPTLARALASVRAATAKRVERKTNAFFVIQVRALNVVFLGHFQGSELFVTPIVRDPRFGFEVGVTMPAKKALEVMLPAAKKHDGNPT
jgi:hypothetical protein